MAGLVSTGGTVATSDDDLKRLYEKLRNKVERGETKKVCSFALLLGSTKQVPDMRRSHQNPSVDRHSRQLFLNEVRSMPTAFLPPDQFFDASASGCHHDAAQRLCRFGIFMSSCCLSKRKDMIDDHIQPPFASGLQ